MIVQKCNGPRMMISQRLCHLIGRRLVHSYCIDPSIGLKEDVVEVQKLARDFAMKEMYPKMRVWDKTEHFPIDVLKKAGDLGFAGIYGSEEFGGSGLTREVPPAPIGHTLHASVIFEQLSVGCVSTAAYIALHNICFWIIDTFGSPELREKYLPSMSRFDTRASYCLTEPDAGSDAASLRTTATKSGDYYIVNGSKSFISGAGSSQNYVVIVRHEGQTGPKGTFCLLIEDGMEGFSVGKKEEKMGWNSQPTRIVSFEDCKVPVTNQIGGDNQGFNIAMAGLNGGRLNIASCSLGAAQHSLELAIEHLKTRKVFGKPLADTQWNQFKLAEMAVKLYSSRLFIRDACRRIDENGTHIAEMSAMAKLYASDECFNVVNTALQMLGGYGYLKDYPLEQYFRDLRVHQILSGTNEVMRLIVGRHLLKNIQ